MVSRLYPSYSYIKRKLRVWRAQKYIALVGEQTVLTSAGPQITLFHGEQYRVGNGNMRNFGPTNPYGTVAFLPMQCLHQKEATGMEIPKMYCSSPQKPHLPVRVCKLPRFIGGSIGPRMERSETLGQPIPMVPRLHQSNGYNKRKLRVWRAQKCIALVGEETVLTSVGPQITLFHWGKYTVRNGNMRNFGPTNPHGTGFPPMQCSYQKEATGMENPKMYCSSPWKNSTYLCGSANYPVSWVSV